MNSQSTPQPQDSVWKDENVITNLRLRVKTFYNADYFETIILPLLDLPRAGHVKGWLHTVRLGNRHLLEASDVC